MSLADDALALIDVLQAAALEPSRWREALVAIGARLDACAGVMYTMTPGRAPWAFTAEFGTDPYWLDLYNTVFNPKLNPVEPRMRAMAVGEVAADWQLVPREDFLRSQFFNEWVTPQGGMVRSA
jgi:hypothetical protein